MSDWSDQRHDSRQPGRPAVNVSDDNYGTITSAKIPRQTELSLRLEF